MLPKFNSEFEENIWFQRKRYEEHEKNFYEIRSKSHISGLLELKRNEKDLTKEIDNCLAMVERTLNEATRCKPVIENKSTPQDITDKKRLDNLEQDNKAIKDAIKEINISLENLNKKVLASFHS